MVPFICILLLSVLPEVSNCQANLSPDDIDALEKETVASLNTFEKKVLVEKDSLGVVDSTTFYCENGEVKLIKYHRFRGALTYGDGPPYADYHHFKQYLFADGQLVLLEFRNLIEYYVNYKKGSKTSLSEERSYLNANGDCIKYFRPRVAEGTSTNVDELINDVPFEEVSDLMYCPYDGKEAEHLLAKLE